VFLIWFLDVCSLTFKYSRHERERETIEVAHKATTALQAWAKTALELEEARAKARAELDGALTGVLNPPVDKAHMITTFVRSLDRLLPEVKVGGTDDKAEAMVFPVEIGFAFEEPSWNGALESLPGDPATLWDEIVEAVAVPRGFTDVTDLVAVAGDRVMTAEEFTPGFIEALRVVISYAREAMGKPQLLMAAGREVTTALFKCLGPTTSSLAKVALDLQRFFQSGGPRSGEVSFDPDGEGD